MRNVEPHTDQRYINAIAEGNDEVVKEIYERYSEKIARFVKKNNGNQEEAKDLFQDALLIIYLQTKREKGLKLTCPFEAYLYTICKFRWINRLQKKSNTEVTLPDNFPYIDLSSIEEDIMKRERRALYSKHFQKLGEQCRDILQLHFNGTKLKQVAEKYQISYDSIKQKISRCRKALTASIRNDKIFKDI